MEKSQILCPDCMEEYLVKTHGDDDEFYCTGCECTFIHLGGGRVRYQTDQERQTRTLG